jgi:hypothetical protein
MLFTIGIEYREQSPREASYKWRYVTLRTVRVRLPNCPPRLRRAFIDRDGRELGRIEYGYLIIHPGYAWNGCSPKRAFLKIWWGTPDFESTHLASLVHDILFQFSGCQGNPFTFHQVNGYFLHFMQIRRFRLAKLYHAAVEECGGSFWAKNHEGLKIRQINN